MLLLIPAPCTPVLRVAQGLCVTAIMLVMKKFLGTGETPVAKAA